VLDYALSREVQKCEAVLGGRKTLFRSSSKPSGSFLIVFGNTLTIKVKSPQIALADGISMFG
jgi:hypothetical protein